MGPGLARSVFDLLLRAYPDDLRQQYGDEMRRVFLQRLRAARRRGPLQPLALWIRELAAALRRRHGGPPDPTPAFRRPGGPSGTPSPIERLQRAMDQLLQDLRFALRTLRKSPGFTAVAVLVLGVGIGANTAIFSVVQAVLLEPLPFAEPDRLLSVWEHNPERGWHRAQVAGANYLDWRERAESFTGIAAHNDWIDEVAYVGDARPVALRANRVTGNFFDVLGVDLAMGAGFRHEHDWAGAGAAVVVSHAFWRQRLGADPDVIGRRIELEDRAHTVVGVAPEGFSYPFDGLDLWLPTAWDPELRTAVFFRRAHGFRAVGRLASGVTVDEAAAELQTIAASLQEEYPETNAAMGVGVTPLHEWVVGDARRTVLVLFAAVGLVLLVACANVANMQLARASGRRREIAVRAALGAGRRRLIRQLLTESLVLAGLGGLVGLAAGLIGLRLLGRLAAEELPRLGSGLRLDPAVLAFTMTIALLAGVLFGLLPALRAGRRGASRLGVGARSSPGRRAGRAAGLLVAVEVALVLPLAISAGLMVRTLWQLQQVDPGFDPSDTVVFTYSVPEARYPEGDEVIGFHRRLVEAVQSRPEVAAAGLSTRLPFVNQRWGSDFRVEGWPADRFGVEVRHDEVSPGLFETMRVPVLQGRAFRYADADAGTERIVAVINRRLAEEYFPESDPIGERLCFSRDPENCRYWYEVVGVVDDVRRESLAAREAPSIYALILQDYSRTARLLVRSERPVEDVVAAVTGEMRELDPALPFSGITTLASVVDDSMARQRLMLTLLGAFAGVAMVLAAVGVYGVVAHATARRTREIGVRVTLGACPGDVVRTVLRRGMLPVATGTVAGLLLAALSSRLLQGLLFGVPATDPVTYGLAAAALSLAAAAACLVPARRALRIDPAEALRGK